MFNMQSLFLYFVSFLCLPFPQPCPPETDYLLFLSLWFKKLAFRDSVARAPVFSSYHLICSKVGTSRDWMVEVKGQGIFPSSFFIAVLSLTALADDSLYTVAPSPNPQTLIFIIPSPCPYKFRGFPVLIVPQWVTILCWSLHFCSSTWK